jgi:uncharacterized protein (TIGR02145 family)
MSTLDRFYNNTRSAFERNNILNYLNDVCISRGKYTNKSFAIIAFNKDKNEIYVSSGKTPEEAIAEILQKIGIPQITNKNNDMNTKHLLKHFEQALKDNDTRIIDEISSILKCDYKPEFGAIEILGREHKTVVIGRQECMAVNLFCPELGFHYNNDPKNSESGYGTLHTHYTMPAIQDVLPKKWRVANDEDWDILIKHVGKNPGTKLKSKEGWKESGNGTDDFGFGAVPAGYRNYYGSSFNHRGYNVHFWSSSVYSSTTAWTKTFDYGNATVYRNYNYRSYGLSVRCIRDIK